MGLGNKGLCEQISMVMQFSCQLPARPDFWNNWIFAPFFSILDTFSPSISRLLKFGAEQMRADTNCAQQQCIHGSKMHHKSAYPVDARGMRRTGAVRTLNIPAREFVLSQRSRK
jgi:hypothetical protein